MRFSTPASSARALSAQRKARAHLPAHAENNQVAFHLAHGCDVGRIRAAKGVHQVVRLLKLSPLISYFPQEALPRLNVLLGFHTERRRPVDHAEYAATLLGFSHNHFERIRGRTKNVADFGHVLDASQNVDWEAFEHHDDKNMSRADCAGIANREVFQLRIIAVGAGQTGPEASLNAMPNFICGAVFTMAS